MSITPPPAPAIPAFTGPESGGRAPRPAPAEADRRPMPEEERSPHPLDEAVGWLERLEARRRQLDAARLELIAAAVEQVTGQAPGQGRGRTGEHAGAPTYGAREIAYRALRAELAAAFNLSEHQTETQMDLAYRLTRHYPATFAALERGELAFEHARVIVDAGLLIGTGDAPELRARRAGYEREVLEVAVRETPNRLRPVARRLAERWAETTLEERHREASARRRVVVIDGEDGMADLIARLPAVEAHAIGDRLTRIARAAERGERVVRASDTSKPDGDRAERRTRDQLRADAFADLLLAADERALFAGSAAEAIRAHVQVIVPAGALPSTEILPGVEPSKAFIDAEPRELVGELVGFGPIDAGTARGIAGAAEHWDRVDVRPDSGEVLGVDRYRPSERMRRLLGARDRTCRFPGCRVPVRRCDVDHTVDAALGGPTTTANLAHLCRGHHTLKHHGDWRVAQESGGTLRWTSPTGRVHVDRPPGALAGAHGAAACAVDDYGVDDIVAASRSGALGTAVAAAIPIA